MTVNRDLTGWTVAMQFRTEPASANAIATLSSIFTSDDPGHANYGPGRISVDANAVTNVSVCQMILDSTATAHFPLVPLAFDIQISAPSNVANAAPEVNTIVTGAVEVIGDITAVGNGVTQ